MPIQSGCQVGHLGLESTIEPHAINIRVRQDDVLSCAIGIHRHKRLAELDADDDRRVGLVLRMQVHLIAAFIPRMRESMAWLRHDQYMIAALSPLPVLRRQSKPSFPWFVILMRHGIHESLGVG